MKHLTVRTEKIRAFVLPVFISQKGDADENFSTLVKNLK